MAWRESNREHYGLMKAPKLSGGKKKIYSLFCAETPELSDALKLSRNRFKASERK